MPRLPSTPAKTEEGDSLGHPCPGWRCLPHPAVLLHEEGQVVGDGQQDLLPLLSGQVGQQPGHELLALPHTQQLQEFIFCLPGNKRSIGTDPKGPGASLSIQKDQHQLHWRTRFTGRVSTGYSDTWKEGPNPPVTQTCSSMTISDPRGPGHAACSLLPTADSLFTAASPDFQDLVDTLHFLALLLLPGGLLLPQGQRHFLLHLLHFHQLQEELEKWHRVRRKLGASSTHWLSRTLPR